MTRDGSPPALRSRRGPGARRVPRRRAHRCRDRIGSNEVRIPLFRSNRHSSTNLIAESAARWRKTSIAMAGSERFDPSVDEASRQMEGPFQPLKPALQSTAERRPRRLPGPDSARRSAFAVLERRGALAAWRILRRDQAERALGAFRGLGGVGAPSAPRLRARPVPAALAPGDELLLGTALIFRGLPQPRLASTFLPLPDARPHPEDRRLAGQVVRRRPPSRMEGPRRRPKRGCRGSWAGQRSRRPSVHLSRVDSHPGRARMRRATRRSSLADRSGDARHRGGWRPPTDWIRTHARSSFCEYAHGRGRFRPGETRSACARGAKASRHSGRVRDAASRSAPERTPGRAPNLSLSTRRHESWKLFHGAERVGACGTRPQRDGGRHAS